MGITQVRLILKLSLNLIIFKLKEIIYKLHNLPQFSNILQRLNPPPSPFLAAVNFG